jgi:hypothetical protein
VGLELVGPIQNHTQHLVRSGFIIFLQHHETLVICGHVVVRPEATSRLVPLEEETRATRLECRFGLNVDSTDPTPWFSYQHNVHYLNDGALLLFDNGNVRCSGVANCHSRGQAWKIEEETMTATPILCIDLGNFSDALGSGEKLPNGNFVFTSGNQRKPFAPFGQSIEVLPDGTKAYVLEGGSREHRSYRMSGFYRGIPQ